MAKRPKIDTNLNEVEIIVVNKERKQIKIHFVGYNKQFDDWRDSMTVKGIYFPELRLEKMFLRCGGAFHSPKIFGLNFRKFRSRMERAYSRSVSTFREH